MPLFHAVVGANPLIQNCDIHRIYNMVQRIFQYLEPFRRLTYDILIPRVTTKRRSFQPTRHWWSLLLLLLHLVCRFCCCCCCWLSLTPATTKQSSNFLCNHSLHRADCDCKGSNNLHHFSQKNAKFPIPAM